MNIPLKSTIFLAATALLLVFTSCEKESSQPSEADAATLQKAKEALASQQLLLSSLNIAQRGAEEANGLTNGEIEERNDTCGSVTVTPPDLVFPKVVTIDFGAGCTDGDGKFKAGKVIMTVGAFWQSGASIVVAYDNYSENGVQVEGQFVFTNQSTATAAILRIDAQNIKFTDPNGYTFAFSGDQTYTQVAGHPSWWDWHDDVYEVTGNIYTTLSNGETVNWLIQTPLEKANACYYVSKGTGILDINGLEVKVDYGNGVCDNKGTFIVNGQVYPFTM